MKQQISKYIMTDVKIAQYYAITLTIIKTINLRLRINEI